MNFGPSERDFIFQTEAKNRIESIILSTIVSMDSSKWELCLSIPSNAEQLIELVNQFEGVPLEDNIFFGKEFLAAAYKRMNNLETVLLGVWETIGTKRALRMYLPVIQDRAGFAGKKIWRGWSHDYAPLGVPIVNQYDHEEILLKFGQLLQKIESPQFSALELSDLPMDNEFAAGLRKIAPEIKLSMAELPVTSRAMLGAATLSKPPEGLVGKAKKLRQYRRQQRRLDEIGQFELEKVQSYNDVILRFEEFLLLESRGWKGRKGTSIHTLKRTAAFARQSVTDLARAGNAAIYSLRLNQKAIASLILLNSNGVYYPWKIAYDQDYSLFSPGALLMLRVSQMLGAQDNYVRADSLAGENNMLVNGIWKKRMPLGSIILPFGGAKQSTLDSVSTSINYKHEFRRKAKQFLNR